MEFVYVVRRRDLFELDCPQGFQRLDPRRLEASYLATIRGRGFFVERRHAELDSSIKQVIPYCVVLDATKTGGEARALRLRRLRKQGEQRLHDKLSIGIGGHVNPIDDAADDAADGGGVERAAREMSILDQGVLRELSEELDLRFVGKSAPPAVPLGVINDDSTSVGSVHFGVVYGIGVSPETTIREKDHMVGDWLPWSQLCEEAASGANYETWSSILLRSLAAEDIRAAHAGESQSHKSSATRALKSAGAVLGGSAS